MKPSPDDHDFEPPMTRAVHATEIDPSGKPRAADPDGTQDDVTKRQSRGGPVRDEFGSDPGGRPPSSGGAWSQSGSTGGHGSQSGSTGGTPSRGVDGKIEPGHVLYSKYRVEKKLGSGAMGDVWLVRHTSMDNLHALKLIVSNIASNEVALQRFKREFKVMASLKHNHAVTIYDACIDDAGGFIDMEFIEGPTLHEILGEARKRPDRVPSEPLMPLSWIVRILDQLTDVLEEAHEKGIVHRDLKPSNLMLVGGRKPGKEYLKVLDFGIAKIRDDPDNAANDMVLTQGFIGTPSYGSPEQAMNRQDIDGRADLYSVGVMLYEFVTGRLPFKGVQYQVMHQHASMPPPPFHEANPQLRPLPELEHAILRVLSKDRDHRQQTARDLFEEVSKAVNVIDGPAAHQPPISTLESLRYNAPVTAPADHWTEHDGGQSLAFAPPPGPDTVPISVVDPGPAKPPAEDTFRFEAIPTPRRSIRGRVLKLVGLAVAVSMLAGFFAMNRRKIVTPPLPPTPPPYVLPDGYAVVLGSDRPGACPDKVFRKADNVEYTRFAEGIYLPTGYSPVDKNDLVNGWPRMITRDVDPTHARFIRIQGGRGWIMGAWDAAPLASQNDVPAHEVLIRSGFYMQETEVTHGQYQDYLTVNKGRFPTSEYEQAFLDLKKLVREHEALRYPANYISHKKAAEVAHYYSALLPTEAQWEFAARSQGDRRRYVWGDRPFPDPKLANIDYVGGQTTSPVTAYKSDVTAQGLFDMTGNLKEMCRDVWKVYRKPSFVQVDPCEDVPDINPPEYVLRGGDFNSTPDGCSTTHRDDKRPEDEFAENVGFRMVVECPDARPRAR